MPSLVGKPALASWSPFRRWNAGDGAERLCDCLLDPSFENKAVDSTRKGSCTYIHRLWALRICHLAYYARSNISTELGELSPDEWSRSISLDLVTGNAASYMCARKLAATTGESLGAAIQLTRWRSGK